MRNNLDLPIANRLDLHDIAEVSDAAVDLDLVLQELLEGRDVEDLVAGGLRGVDDELSSVNISPSSHSPPSTSPSIILKMGMEREGRGGKNTPSS